MKLAEALENKKFDVRLLDRYLADGKISKVEYEKYIAALEDATTIAQEVDLTTLQ